jgi:hypothetical protein
MLSMAGALFHARRGEGATDAGSAAGKLRIGQWHPGKHVRKVFERSTKCGRGACDDALHSHEQIGVIRGL